jgi:hypothetical protein
VFKNHCCPHADLLDSQITKEEKLGILKAEVEVIHFANSNYWQLCRITDTSREAKAEHDRRRERLEYLRGEFQKIVSE